MAPRGEVSSVRIPRALRLWWGCAALLSIFTVAALAAFLPFAPFERLLYLSVTGALLLGLFALLWPLLDEIRIEGGEEVAPLPGVANTVTLGRAVAGALLAGLLVVPRPAAGAAWLPAVLYLGVVLGDAFDGWLARRRLFVTRLGERLDLEVDAASLLVATLLAVRYGALPGWVVLAGVARYAYVGARAVARSRAPDGGERSLPPSRRRRLRAGQQMGLLAVALWPPVPRAGLHLAAWLVSAPFLAGFVRDGLAVTGALDPASRLYQRLRAGILLAVETVVPVAARLVLAAGLSREIATRMTSGTDVAPADRWAATLAAWGWPGAEAWARLAILVVLAAVAAAVVGVLPRLASLVLAAGFFLELESAALDPIRALLLLAVLWILVFGAGPGVLWAPDEELFGPERRGAAQ